VAIAHEHVASWTSDSLWRAIAERVRLGLPTLVLDRRVESGEVANDDLQSAAVVSGLDTRVDLADASRWVSLIVPAPGTLQRDLQSFSRALTIWCAPPEATTSDFIPDFAKATGNPRITEIVKALYDESPGTQVVEAIGDEVVRHWRSTLRDLGEGPRAVVDDPWFSHLFLSPTAAELSLAGPYTLLDLRSPRVPRRAAQQVAAVVFDHLLERANQDPAAPELVCFILEAGDLEPAFKPAAVHSEGKDMNSPPNIRLVWIDEVDDHREAPKFASTVAENLPKSDDDGALYRMFSSSMDKRHRAAYVKGIMYGYLAFCTIEKSDELPEDLVFLREAGMILSMSSPLVELFDDY
jgi:hypothetical protein